MRFITVLVLAIGIKGAFGEASTRPAEDKPIDVLMVVGGEAHDYDKLPAELAAALESRLAGRVRLIAAAGLSPDQIAAHDVLMFNDCEQTTLTDGQKAAVLNGLRSGKGLVAMHCALWSFQHWPEWRRMLGGLVLKHDPFGTYEVEVVHPSHPISGGLPARFEVTDEPYLVDERSADVDLIVQTAGLHGGRKVPEPQAWTTRYLGGRVFVTTFGHDARVQRDPNFLRLVSNGIRWAAGRLGPAWMLSEVEKKQGFLPLFDGRSLSGWKYEPAYWSVRDGRIIGDTKGKALDKYSYAISQRSFGDFVLRFSVKLGRGSNSGVQFRSRELPDFEVAGYQADIVMLGWGNLHEQNGRRRLVDGWTGKGETVANPSDWNDMEVTAKGPNITIRLNGLTTAEYTETDASRPRDGIIALQLHRGEPTCVEFTNIRIKPLD